jgi:hypothetical protein
MSLYNDTTSYNHFIIQAPDHFVWKPISESEKDHFLSLVKAVRDSINTTDKHKKGTSLESLMTYVYKRFEEVADVHPNVSHGDNQFDHIIEFHDGWVPPFIYNYIGLRMVGESKNHKKSIGVREVADLNELLRYRRAKVGIFSSVKTFSRGNNGSPWQYAEGKRRKLSLARGVVIIGFTLAEIESLTENNFYTMLREKYYNLVDEIEDDYTDHLIDDEKTPYSQRLYLALLQMKKNDILSEDCFQNSLNLLIEKYGPITEDIED